MDFVLCVTEHEKFFGGTYKYKLYSAKFFKLNVDQYTKNKPDEWQTLIQNSIDVSMKKKIAGK